MATKFAFRNGFFDNNTTWSLNSATYVATTIPDITDDAVANTRVVTITSNVICNSISNDSIYGGLSGGMFLLNTTNNPVNIFANIRGINCYGNTFYCISGFGANMFSLTGIVSAGGQSHGTGAGRSQALFLGNTGTVNLSCRYSWVGSGYVATAIHLISAAKLNIYGKEIGTSVENSRAFMTYAGGGEVNVYGDFISTQSNGTCLEVRSATGVNVYGNIDFAARTATQDTVYGIQFYSTIPCVTNIYGNMLGAQNYTNSGTVRNNIYIDARPNCLFNIYGDIYQGNTTGAYGGYIINNVCSSRINIYGKIYTNNSYKCPVLYNNSYSNITIFQDISASNICPIIVNEHCLSNLNLHGDIINAENGMQALYSRQHNWTRRPTNAYIRYATGLSNPVFLYHTQTEALTAFSMPPASSVRSGLSYAGGALTGTCIIPDIKNVTYGVPVDDNKSGIGFISDVSSLFNLQVSSLTANNSIGLKMANSMTNDFLSKTLDSYLNVDIPI